MSWRHHNGLPVAASLVEHAEWLGMAVRKDWEGKHWEGKHWWR